MPKKAAILMLIFLFSLPAFAVAANTTLVPELGLGAEHNDNITFNDDEKKGDTIYRVSPGISLESRSETLDAQLSAQARANYYDTYTELDGIDQTYLGRVRYGFSPRFTSIVEAEYRIDTQIDRDLDTTGLLLTAATRDRYRGLVGGTYAPTELTTVALNYSYIDDAFDTSDLSDSQIHNVNLSFNHDLSWIFPKTLVNLNFSYGRYAYDRTQKDTQSSALGTIKTIYEENTDVDNYGISAGVQYDWSELFVLTFTLGGRYTETINDQEVTQTLSLPPNPDVVENVKEGTDEKQWAGSGEARIAYRGERDRVQLGLSRDLRPASGSRGPTVRTDFFLLISRQFTEEARGSLDMRYFINKEDLNLAGLENRESKTFSIRPAVRYQFHRNLFLRIYYNYTMIQRDTFNDDVHQNVVFAAIEGRYPLFE
jgi:hypothetical protein